MKNKCIFCGHPEIRQPLVNMPLVVTTTPMCAYHYKMFKEWAEGNELHKMMDIYEHYKKKEGRR